MFTYPNLRFLDQSLQCFCSSPQVRKLGPSTRAAAKVKSQGQHRTPTRETAPALQQQAQTHTSPAALTTHPLLKELRDGLWGSAWMALTNPLSSPVQFLRALWVRHPHGTQGPTAAQLLSKSKAVESHPFSPLCPSSRALILTGLCTQTIQLLPVPGGCPEWLHHWGPTPKMGSSTWSDWRTLALQEHRAPFKSRLSCFHSPDY